MVTRRRRVRAAASLARQSGFAAAHVARHVAVVDAEEPGERDEFPDEAAARQAVEDRGGAADGPAGTLGLARGIAALQLVMIPYAFHDKGLSRHGRFPRHGGASRPSVTFQNSLPSAHQRRTAM